MCLRISASLQNVLSPLQLCADPEWPEDHRCAVNWEKHTSVIKAVGGLVPHQLPPIPLLESPPSPYNSILSAELIIVLGQFCPWQFCHFLMMPFQRGRACVLPAPGPVGANRCLQASLTPSDIIFAFGHQQSPPQGDTHKMHTRPTVTGIISELNKIFFSLFSQAITLYWTYTHDCYWRNHICFVFPVKSHHWNKLTGKLCPSVTTGLWCIDWSGAKRCTSTAKYKLQFKINN